MDQMTKELAMAKLALAKKRKGEVVARIEKHLVDSYEKETGLKANYVFTM